MTSAIRYRCASSSSTAGASNNASLPDAIHDPTRNSSSIHTIAVSARLPPPSIPTQIREPSSIGVDPFAHACHAPGGSHDPSLPAHWFKWKRRHAISGTASYWRRSPAWVIQLAGFASFASSMSSTGRSSRAIHSIIRSVSVIAVPPSTLLYFLLFFVLGYLVYAALYAALGSLVNRIEDVNSVTTPLNIVLIATYFLSIYALGNPDAEYVKWLSYVPFFTPMLMFIRTGG